MASSLGWETDCPLQFFLADESQMRKRNSKFVSGVELGLHYYEENSREITTRSRGREKTRTELLNQRCAIYILSHLPEKQFCEVAAHELAHDYLRHRYGNIRDLTIQEGFAEEAAWRMNRIMKQAERNDRIEKNSDPVYGAGFRKVHAVALKGAAALDSFLKKHGTGRN